jgi:hypothetical protein
MAKAKRVIGAGYDQLRFDCPACGSPHVVSVGPGGWVWNDSFDSPTLTPSVLVRWPANPDALEEFKEWRTERVCHSFVRDGKIEFLGDCTHALAGQTVDLAELGRDNG